MSEKYFVYILECVDKSCYVGSTNNVGERLNRHNAGEAAEWTKNRRPVKVVYLEEHDSLLLARQREEQIKGWSRVKNREPDQWSLEKDLKHHNPSRGCFGMIGFSSYVWIQTKNSPRKFVRPPL